MKNARDKGYAKEIDNIMIVGDNNANIYGTAQLKLDTCY